MCKDLGISWNELQELPSDVRRTWLSFMGGEAQARKELAERARAQSKATVTR